MSVLCRYRRTYSWTIPTFVITLVVVLFTTLTVRYVAPSVDDDDNGLAYGPTDTRIVSVSSILCSAATFQVGVTSDSGYSVSLYSLQSPPQLTGHEDFSINDQPSFEFSNSYYQKYYYFLPQGSNFSLSTCVLDTSSQKVTFYMIAGQSNFEKWEHNKKGWVSRWNVTTPCATGNDTFSYSVTSDDFHYLVFYTGSFSYPPPINVSIDFHQTRYELPANDTIYDSCSQDSTYFYDLVCFVGLPLSGSINLMRIDRSESYEWDWNDKVSVDFGCGARIWMYAMFSLVALVFVVTVLVTIITCVYCLCLRKRKRATVSQVNAASGDQAPLIYDSAPPSVDPTYPQSKNSSGYGSTFTAPPAYKP